ncbi:MAG: winged helix-turn-helix domain-containing protein [Jatrophihabitans sp.]
MSLESRSPGTGLRRTLADPIAIRALAHPIRLQLRDLLDLRGPLTAAAAARELGISQALASHHLRQLAKYRFVEPAPATDARERPWQITETSVSWRGAERTDQGAAAADLLELLLANQAIQHLADWQRRRRDWDSSWRDHAGLAQNLLELTAQEMQELGTAIDALIAPYTRPRSQPATGTVMVDLTIVGVPLSAATGRA